MWVTRTSVAIIGVGIVGLFASGCDNAQPGDVSEVRDPIINGTTVNNDTAGTVSLSNNYGSTSDGCSGTLLSPFWVLTAHHCVSLGAAATGGQATAPGRLTVSTNAGGFSSVAQIVRHPTLDVALLQLTTPLFVAGTSQPFATHLYRGTSASLVGQTLFCEGWGSTSLMPAPFGSGGGLHSAMLPILSVGQPAQTYIVGQNMNVPAQSEFHGDSGSSCFVTLAGQLKATGVASFLTAGSQVNVQHTGADALRAWVTGVMGSAAAPGSPAGYERQDGVTSIVYRNVDTSDPIELCFGGVCGASWSRADFHSLFGAPVAKGSGLMSAYVRADGNSAFVWRGSADNHIWEASFNGSWHIGDVTVASSAPVGLSGDPSTYVRTDLVGAVVYQGTDSHIHESELTFSPFAWHDADISGAASGPTGSNPIGYVRSDGVNAVVYMSGTSVIELALVPTVAAPDEFLCSSASDHWVATNLTSAAGSAAVPAALPPHPYTRSDGVSAVVYLGTNSHIIELSQSNGGWIATDLTASAGTGLASSTPIPYVREDGVNAILYQDGASNLSELELSATAWNSAGVGWTHVSLTTATTPNSPIPFFYNGSLLASAFVRGDGSTEVVFQGSNKHVYGITHVISTGRWVLDTANNATGDLTPGGE